MNQPYFCFLFVKFAQECILLLRYQSGFQVLLNCEVHICLQCISYDPSSLVATESRALPFKFKFFIQPYHEVH